MKKLLLTTVGLLVLNVGTVSAEETKSYSPYAEDTFP